MIAVGGLFYQAEKFLDAYFQMLLAQDYPKRKMRLIWLYGEGEDATLVKLKEFGEAHGSEYAEFTLFQVNRILGSLDGEEGKHRGQENIVKAYNHLVQLSYPDDLIIMEQDIEAPPDSIKRLIQLREDGLTDKNMPGPVAAVAGICLVTGGELKVEAKNGGTLKVCGLPTVSAYCFQNIATQEYQAISLQSRKVNAIILAAEVQNRRMYVDGIATGLSLLTRQALNEFPFEKKRTGTQDLNWCREARARKYKIMVDTGLWYEHNHYKYRKEQLETGLILTLLDSTKTDGIMFEVVDPTVESGGENEFVNA